EKDIKMITLILITTIVIYLIWLWDKQLRKNDFPPGPPRLPVLGSVSSLLENRSLPLHVRFYHLVQRYGPIVGINVLGLNIVILGELDIIKEAFKKEELSYRATNKATLARSGTTHTLAPANRGLLSSSSDSWQQHRRFSLKTLRDFGFGKVGSETIIIEEATVLLKELSDKHGSSIEINQNLFSICILNVIWTLIAGTRYSHSDPELQSLSNSVNRLASVGLGGSPVQAFPNIMRAFPNITGYNEFISCNEDVKQFAREQIRIHKKNLDPENPCDFIDVYLAQLVDENENMYTFSEEELVVVCLDMFVAGIETTTTTLLWAVLLMTKYPHIQEKVHKELRSVLKEDELPTMAHKTSLPYTEAVMSEIHRFGTIVPNALPHYAEKDTMLGGYRIPRGSFVYSSIYSVHNNATYWEDPQNFRPERFLTDEGIYKKHDHLVPFGIGKHICLGESLAKMETFIFFTSLMSRMQFSLAEDTPLPSTERQEGVTCGPKPYNVIIHDRSKVYTTRPEE
ncbi:unnamed protein product, partial [Meganyctiphanes norvegica]